MGADEPAPADSVTLDAVLGQSIKLNPTLISNGVDIDVAAAGALQAGGLDDWEVDAHANWTSSRAAPIDNGGFQQLLSSDTLHLDGTLLKPLTSGGRLGLQLANDYNNSNYLLNISGLSGEVSASTYRPTLSLTYFQPLLRGFGKTAARAPQRKARAQLDVAFLDRETSASTVVRDVVQYYWELAYAAREVDIRKASLTLAEEQLRITQARLDVGVGAPTDIAAVKQGIATRQEDLLLSEQNVTQRALDLRQLAGLPIAPPHLRLVASDPLIVKTRDLSFEEALVLALERSPQLAALAARGKLAEVDIDVTQNGLLPQLDLTVSLGPTGNGTDLGAALGQMVGFNDYTVSGGLTFTMPVENRNARGSLAVARANLHKVRVNEVDVRNQITISVARDVDFLNSARRRMEIDAEATKLALINLDAEKARFEVGRSTNFDVLKRVDELAQSQLREARAAADYLKALAVLEALTGELMPRYGLKLK